MPYLQVGDATLYAEISGDGDPVLLLHGGLCSLETMRPQADALALRYRVFAFERPGHGRSADVDGDYRYEHGVAQTLAYLDAVGLESAHVVGYSDGAIIGLLLARDHPARVRSLVSISANLDQSAFTTSPEAESATMLAQSEEDSPGPAANAERLHYERLSPDGPGHLDVVLRKLLRMWAGQPRIDPAGLAGIAAPVLVMSGDHDTVRPDHSLLIAASIPGAQLCVVPKTTHDLVCERPELVSLLIRQFLP
ncbi:alpha/beta fold hydrolase [Amycolatopsis silviterrae]|uniref:Alpha/beta fold hydrolase n=1 Tax=Amycolatopsis silviterrae TaxID=1656914 RepID=A0ABW5H4Q1_9PSEU